MTDTDCSEADELTLPGIGELLRDPEARQAQVTLALYRLSNSTGCPEAIEQAYSLGHRVGELAEQHRVAAGGEQPDSVRQVLAAVACSPLMKACDAIPDFTLSKWACTPGGHWEPVRQALRAARFDQGLNLDAPFEDFDSHGWLRSRREKPAPATQRKDDPRT